MTKQEGLTIKWMFDNLTYKTDFQYKLSDYDKKVLRAVIYKLNPEMKGKGWVNSRVAESDYFIGKTGIFEVNYEYVKTGARPYPNCINIETLYVKQGNGIKALEIFSKYISEHTES